MQFWKVTEENFQSLWYEGGYLKGQKHFFYSTEVFLFLCIHILTLAFTVCLYLSVINRNRRWYWCLHMGCATFSPFRHTTYIKYQNEHFQHTHRARISAVRFKIRVQLSNNNKINLTLNLKCKVVFTESRSFFLFLDII